MVAERAQDRAVGVEWVALALRRRSLQLALAASWLFAGILQAQTFMFTAAFAKMVLAVTGPGNPGWIAASIQWSAHLVEAQPVLCNSVFALVQIALGLGIAVRATARMALGASILWALLVWWFGEGLGGLLVGGASALRGAPGAVLLYAVLAVLLWPTVSVRGRSAAFVAAGTVGLIAARIVWAVLWAGLAALNLQPANLAPGAVHGAVAGMGDGQPGWVSAAVNGFAAVSRGRDTVLTITATVVLLVIAVGVFLPAGWQRGAVVLAVVAAAFIWLVGEALGALFGGQSTDPNSGPLLIFIALAYWPATTPSTAGSPMAATAAHA